MMLETQNHQIVNLDSVMITLGDGSIYMESAMAFDPNRGHSGDMVFLPSAYSGDAEAAGLLYNGIKKALRYNAPMYSIPDALECRTGIGNYNNDISHDASVVMYTMLDLCKKNNEQLERLGNIILNMNSFR